MKNSFEETYPNIAYWFESQGWIEIGQQDDYNDSFIRALDDGKKNSIRRKKGHYVYLYVFFLIVAHPNMAYAHDLFTFVFLPSLTGLIVAALIAAAVKYFWVSRMIQCREKNTPKLYIGVAFLELAIMLLSFTLSYYLTSKRNTITLLFITCIIYSIIGLIPNFILTKKIDQLRGFKSSLFNSISKSYLFTLIFPALAWIFGIIIAKLFYGF